MGVEHDIVCIDCFGVLICSTGDVLQLCEYVTPPTRHKVSSEGSFFFFFKLITFTLAYSYNVKQLTCIIFCSSGLQNIYIQAP